MIKNVYNLYSALQYYLKKRNLYSGLIDSVWGRQSKAAWEGWCFQIAGMMQYATKLPDFNMLPEVIQQDLLKYLETNGVPETPTVEDREQKVAQAKVAKKELEQKKSKRSKVVLVLPNGNKKKIWTNELDRVVKYIKDHKIDITTTPALTVDELLETSNPEKTFVNPLGKLVASKTVKVKTNGQTEPPIEFQKVNTGSIAAVKGFFKRTITLDTSNKMTRKERRSLRKKEKEQAHQDDKSNSSK